MIRGSEGWGTGGGEHRRGLYSKIQGELPAFLLGWTIGTVQALGSKRGGAADPWGPGVGVRLPDEHRRRPLDLPQPPLYEAPHAHLDAEGVELPTDLA